MEEGETVFGDTPLAEYLSDAGVEDWGIENTPLDPVPDAEPESRYDRKHVNSDGLIPMLLTGQVMQECRFRGMVRTALASKLSPKETAQFLEQFRYIVISSQLLEPRPIYTTWSLTVEEKRMQLLFKSTGPWDFIKLEPKHLVGGGGVVVVVAVLLYWRANRQQQRTESTTNSGVALVVGLLVVLFLFSHSRRRLLRRLHAKALGYMDHFVVASKCFDGDVVRALRAIQELELVDSGFAAMAGPRSITSPRVRSGKQLRATLGAVLHLATQSYLDAIKDCLCMCSELDLQQYFEIYDLNPSEVGFVMNDGFVGFMDDGDSEQLFGAQGCHLPVSLLKEQFRKVHFLRRALLCCLVTVPSTGECTPTELESWTVVTDQLRSGYELMEQLSSAITKERLYHEEPPSNDAYPVSSAPRQPLWELSATARHLVARLDLVQHAGLGPDEYQKHTEQLGSEISELQRLWDMLNSRQHASAESSLPSLTNSTPSTAYSTPDLGDGSSIFSVAPSEPFTAETLHDDGQIFEAVSIAPQPKPSKLSREERIKLAREERENTIDQRKQHDRFMMELTNVLSHRSSRG